MNNVDKYLVPPMLYIVFYLKKTKTNRIFNIYADF